MTALAWIVKEAKSLRRKFPNRYTGKNAWRKYVAQASAVYASKHKGRSPVGRKRKKRIGSTKFVEKSESTRTKPARTIRVTRTKKGRYKSFHAIGSVPAGHLKAELKKRKKDELDQAVLSHYHATTVREKKKRIKRVHLLKRQLSKL